MSFVCAPSVCTVHHLSAYEMEQHFWIFLALWFALQVPLGSFLGDFIRFGAKGEPREI